MENASKALLMAGGILIALLVIGALILMFNQIGDYEKAQGSSDKNSQLAEFNLDFEKYMDDKGITGADIISLINKVNDYNSKSNEVANSVDYSIKMSITISNLDTFNSKYAYENESNKIFSQRSYKIDETNSKSTNRLQEDLDKAKELENIPGITSDQLKQLSGMYNETDRDGSIGKIKEKLVEIDRDKYSNWNGRTFPTIDSIIKYRQYWEFKTSKFMPDGEAKYENGQIKSMKFIFKE